MMLCPHQTAHIDKTANAGQYMLVLSHNPP